MKAIWLRRAATAIVLGVLTWTAVAEAGGRAERRAARVAAGDVGYYDPAWGPAPHPLLVPPTARRHIEYQQGVGSAMNLPIGRGYPASVLNGGPFAPMSPFPYSTNHMGVYYLRAPR